MDDWSFALLSCKVSLRCYLSDATIYTKGDSADYAYIILGGSVKVRAFVLYDNVFVYTRYVEIYGVLLYIYSLYTVLYEFYLYKYIRRTTTTTIHSVYINLINTTFPFSSIFPGSYCVLLIKIHSLRGIN